MQPRPERGFNYRRNQIARTWVANFDRVGIGFEDDAVEHFTDRTGPEGLGPIRFIGGGATSRLWCQTMADILRRPIDQVAEPAAANARGAALLACVATGTVTWDEIPGISTGRRSQ